MGYWPTKMKRRRGSWLQQQACKLVLLGATGSHTVHYHCRPLWRLGRTYYIEMPNGTTVDGSSPSSCVIRMARVMELT